MSKPEIVVIGGAQLVVGLMWQPLSGSNAGERQAEVKGFGKELDLNLQVMHRENLCVGLAKGNSGIKPGAVSLAAAMSDKLHALHGARDFILVVELEGGQWYYLAQKDGVIFPDGDQLYTSEDLAKSRFFEDSSLADWGQIVVPSHWGVSGSLDVPELEDVLPFKGKGKSKLNAPKQWKLTAISVSPAQFVREHATSLVIIVAAIGTIVIGMDQLKAWQQQKAIAEAARVAAELAAMQEKELPRPRPWGEIPHASDLMRACMRTVGSVHLFPGNWDLLGVHCGGGVMTVSWKPRPYGWIEHLKQVVPDVVIATDGSLASTTKPLPQMRTPTDEDVFTANERMVAMYAAAQRYGVKFTATPPVTNTVQALPGQGAAPGQEQLWEEMGWKAEGITLPEVVIQALDGNGFRLSAMNAQWRDGQFVWTMEGSQYVRK